MPNDDRSVINKISLNGKEPATKQHHAQYKAGEASSQTATPKAHYESKKKCDDRYKGDDLSNDTQAGWFKILQRHS